jgi:hypothetical protein
MVWFDSNRVAQHICRVTKGNKKRHLKNAGDFKPAPPFREIDGVAFFTP